jgi:hypothetical protein
MLAMISSYASWYAEDYLQRELSLPKLINWLKRKNRLVNAVHDGTLEALCATSGELCPSCCVSKNENAEQVVNS